MLRVGAVAIILLAAIAAAQPPASAADGSPPPSSTWYRVDEGGDVQVDLYFGWTSTCPHCAKARPFVAQLQAELSWLTVHSLQLDGDNEPNRRSIVELAATVGEEIRSVPAFLFAGRLRTGFDEATTTGVSLRAELVAYHDGLVAALRPTPSATPIPSPTPAGVGTPVVLPFVGPVDASAISLPILAVVLGGLDAFNPCALSVLLFLLSVLVGSHSRRRMALIGGTFVLVSGLTYFVLMAAWLNLFLLFGALRIVTLVAGGAAVLAALINIKDFAWFGRGPSLVIPGSAKPGIFGRMLDLSATTRLTALVAGTVLVAVVANSYEMLCTGGFPVVFTRVLTLSSLPLGTYYAYLLLYNVVYVAPLLAVVAFFTWKLGSRGISEREMRRLKLLSGLLMLGLGLLLLLAPERLTDFGATIGVFLTGIAIWGSIVLADRMRSRPAGSPPGTRHGARARR
jgi:thiol-disulfide isomerase/thioredoxin